MVCCFHSISCVLNLLEFFERQTLRELVEEGLRLSESNAWKLFRYTVGALVYVPALGIASQYQADEDLHQRRQ